MKRIFQLLVVLLTTSSASALEKQVASPDGKLVVTINDNNASLLIR